MTESTQEVLRVSGLGKRYRIFSSPHERLMALLGFSDRSRAHWALKDVSFYLKKGQCLGVIGDNGAGKSTLLKLLAETLQPSHGQLWRKGRVTAILELGAGFHPEFTGRENLMFGGSLIGLDAIEMRKLGPSIIEFSELGEAIDRQIKTYSSGMIVRLAFALVTAIQPEVLIIDEALSVGDQHFQKKCTERIESYRENGCTIVFCSHSLYHVRQLCDQVLWLDHGIAQALGDTEAVLAAYESHVRKKKNAETKMTSSASVDGEGTPDIRGGLNVGIGASIYIESQPKPKSENTPGLVQAVQQPDGSRAALVSVEVAHLNSLPQSQIFSLVSPDLIISLTARMPGDEVPSLAVMIEQANGVGITTTGTHANQTRPRRLPNGDWQAEVKFSSLPLHTGEYVISAYLFDESGLIVYEEWPNCIQFVHVFPKSTPGLVRLPHIWT